MGKILVYLYVLSLLEVVHKKIIQLTLCFQEKFMLSL